MNKAVKFVIMDFISLKTEFAIKHMIMLVVLSILGFNNMGVYGIALSLVPLIGILISYPFAMGYDGLDSLYASLSISRKTVVGGRYLFALFASAAAAIVYFLVGIAVAGILSSEINLLSYLAVLIGAFFVANVTNAISIPLMFKIGFKQARTIISLLPMGLMLAVMLLVNFQEGESHYIVENVSYNMNASMFGAGAFAPVVFGVAVCVLVFFGSYVLSLKFYQQRDF